MARNDTFDTAFFGPLTLDLEYPYQHDYTYSPCTTPNNITGIMNVVLRMVGTKGPGNDSYLFFKGNDGGENLSGGLVTEVIGKWVWRRC
jgi:hypothetical protein